MSHLFNGRENEYYYSVITSPAIFQTRNEADDDRVGRSTDERMTFDCASEK